MIEHLLEMKDAPALSEMMDGKRVPHRMDGSGRRFKPKSAAQLLHIAWQRMWAGTCIHLL